MARVSVWRRVGTRLSAALVAVAVPFAMVGLSPLFVSTASTVPTAAAVVATTPAREAVLLDRLDDPAPSAGRPQVVAEQTTISGGLVLTTKADRNRKIAVKSRKGGHVWTASSLAEHDLPSAAMRAYKHAAASIDTSIPGCHLPWTLLAGIGRVESDHGRYGGSVLGNDGVPRPAIVGVALNGKGPVAAIRDSDDGAFDGDKVWDRAVGPMQFIPTTWQGAGRDGDGDGKKSPNDIDDASLAAAAYLCHAGRNLSDQSAVRSAVLSYNPSDYYVALVTAFARGYSTGVFVIPSPEVQPGAGDGVVPVAGDHAAKVKAAKAAKVNTAKARAKAAKSSARAGKAARRQPRARAHALAVSRARAAHATAVRVAHLRAAARAKAARAAAAAAGGGKSTPSPSPSPSAGPPKVLQASGALVSVDGGWRVDGVRLSAGDLGSIATKDYDKDPATTSLPAEFTALAGTGSRVTLSYTDRPFRITGFSVG